MGKAVKDIIGKSNRELFGEDIAKDMDRHVLESYHNKCTVSIEHGVPSTEGTVKTYSTLYSYHASTSAPATGAVGAGQGLDRGRAASFSGETREQGGANKTATSSDGIEPPAQAHKRQRRSDDKGGEGDEREEEEAYIFGVCRDITMRKMVETAAVDATKAKTRFLANMSHDLRTPLTGIINVAHLLREGNLGH